MDLIVCTPRWLSLTVGKRGTTRLWGKHKKIIFYNIFGFVYFLSTRKVSRNNFLLPGNLQGSCHRRLPNNPVLSPKHHKVFPYKCQNTFDLTAWFVYQKFDTLFQTLPGLFLITINIDKVYKKVKKKQNIFSTILLVFISKCNS